jgi:hypothetical protein
VERVRPSGADGFDSPKRNWTNAPFRSNIPARAMTKDTAKALVIIIAALGVLVMLLLWANHLRPHGI